MKRLFFAVVALTVTSALAADKYITTMAGDAGTTGHSYTIARPQLSTVSLQCTTASCYRTGTSAPVAANCQQDPTVPAVNRAHGDPTQLPGPVVIEMGADSFIAVKTLDGGEPSCILFNRTKNP